ncbi:1-acyl-sn-glycerol-3-phosphate acyltransferase epsilon [Aplysia californica]|uniref:1-acyl-sn-glycerol-3-phosphate acyltransferase epsilon n=1 Tax=Aplysia californica TaxID=6500 RepID=A0ABM1VTZ0_APLCA|nr:1-acyl-sn-glycerol-3-phosphate acyltransferase epsilon [Aplysia californica]XP_035825882.1 1-acyl-sn-glycerol-3-phosphate acyltransferase epsilon [Aplysia californica]
MLTVVILIQNLRWMVPTTFMIGAAPAYITVWTAWRALSAILPRWVYVKGDDFLFSTYKRNVLFCFETLTGTELMFYGDPESMKELVLGENALYISNHQCTVDWVMASSVALRRGSLGRLRYVLKDGLRYLPLYGFYLGMHGSVFVKRAGRFSKEKAEKQLSRDAKDKKPMWLVIFPEGTRFNPELPNVIEESKQFTQSQGLEPLNTVLYPRIRAVQVCVEQLRNSVESLYDVTLAYSNTFDYDKGQRRPSPTMQDFLMGHSQRVHVHIQRIPISDVPSEPEELKTWLYQRFQEKEKLLNYFYSAPSDKEAKFPGEAITKPLPLTYVLPSFLLWGGAFAVANWFKQSRDLYWKAGSIIGCAGLIWMGIHR